MNAQLTAELEAVLVDIDCDHRQAARKLRDPGGEKPHDALPAGFVWMGATRTPTGYAFAANLQQIGCGVMLPTLLVWATSGLAFSIRGRGTGIWQATFSIGQFLSGITLTFFSKQLGGLMPTFSALGVVCFGATLAALISAVLPARSAYRAAARTR